MNKTICYGINKDTNSYDLIMAIEQIKADILKNIYDKSDDLTIIISIERNSENGIN